MTHGKTMKKSIKPVTVIHVCLLYQKFNILRALGKIVSGQRMFKIIDLQK
jgi:hypothetical protein